MEGNQSEPLPLQVMPAKRPRPSHRVGLTIAVVLLGLIVFLLLDSDSFLHDLLFGDKPMTSGLVLTSLKDYGHLLFTAYMLVTAAVLFLENRNPDRTLAWLLVLALLPFVGIALYWVVGPNFRYLADKRRFRLPRPSGVTGEVPAKRDIPLVTDTAHLLYRSSGARLVTGRDVTVFYDGKAAFERIKERLRGAERGILLESYIIENDRLGNEIKDILIERASRGVFVAVLYDAVGSWHMGDKFVKALRDGGVTAMAFLPVSFPMFRGANYRNHRKIIIVDGEYAFTGGLNIGDEYVSDNPKYTYWRDTHMEFSGESVSMLRAVFLSDFAFCGASDELLAKASAAATSRTADEPHCWPDVCPPGKIPMQIVASGPDTPWDTIQKGYFSVIARARKTLWITSPYLVPGDALMEAMCASSLSGVDVRLLLPGKADHTLVHWASMNCVDELLRAGVRIFLYDAEAFVHAKTMVADGVLASVGTANLDTRSLQINFEVQVFLYDRPLAKAMQTAFENDAAVSRELTFSGWRGRPKIQRVKESVGKLFSSLL